MQIHPAVPGHGQQRLSQQRTVGDHRAAIRSEGTQFGNEFRGVRPLWAQNRDAGIQGALGHCGRSRLSAPAGGGIRAGQHRHDVVAGGFEQPP